VKFNCPKCGRKIEVEGGSEGVDFDCPSCGAKIRYSTEKVHPGKVIAGFELQELLGLGGMGEVWLAFQKSMDRQVALKILSPYLSDDKSFVENFLEEVRVAAKMEHPNIVSAFDAGVDDGIYYLAMSYIPGETFAVRVARERKLPEHEILKIALYVSKALDYAWNKFKIIHRDVNPSNIMLTPEGDIKLMDMGISKNMEEDDGQPDENLVGTPNYMSPEQIRGGETLDVRSDIYSLGTTLYHLATGAVPFAGNDTYDVLQRQLQEELAPVEELNPNISKNCARLINRMIRKRRDERPGSWAAVIESIEGIIMAAGLSGAGASTSVHDTPHKQVTISRDHIRKLHEEHMRGSQNDKRKPPLPLLVFLLGLVALSALLAMQVLEKRQAERAEQLETELEQAEERSVESGSGLKPASDGSGTAVQQPATPVQPEQVATTNRLDEVRAAWQRVIDFESENTQRHAQVSREFEQMLEMASGTEFEQAVREKIEHHRRMHEAELVMRELGVRARIHVAAGDYMTAARLYRDYNGQFAEETRGRRMLLAERFMRQSEEGANSFTQEETAAKPYEQFLIDVSEKLWIADLDGAVSTCETFQQQAGIDEEHLQSCAEIKGYIEEIRSSDRHIMDALTSGKISRLTLADRSGPREVNAKFENGQLLAEVRQGRGLAYFPFTVRQIPAEEKYKLLQGLVDPVARELYIGIYYLRKSLYEEAIEHFSRTGDLSQYLVDRTREGLAELQEEQVRNALLAMLRSADMLAADDDLDWSRVLDAESLERLNRNSADSLLKQLKALLESGLSTSFIENNSDEIEDLCSRIDELDFSSDWESPTSGGGNQMFAQRERRFYEQILRARSSRGIPVRCDPKGSGSSVIPEVVDEKINSNSILVVQEGDYNNREIKLSNKRSITIKSDGAVRNCRIRLEDCSDINIQGLRIDSLTILRSNYAIIDSHLTELKSYSSAGLVHNSRIFNVVCSKDLTLDHCLIRSIGAYSGGDVLIRNSIIYGGYMDRLEWIYLPAFRWLQEKLTRIRLVNSLIYTRGELGVLFEKEHEIHRLDQWNLERRHRAYHTMESMKELLTTENLIFEDPDFTDAAKGDYKLRFNSPAKRKSISGKNDLGPTPDLRPMTL
jgi:serine/threonine protein kinase